MATDPLYLDLDGGLGPSYGAQEYRQGDTALLAGPSSGQIFSGVRGGAVSVVGTAITIAPLTYVLNGGNAPGSEGCYRGVFLTGDANLSKTLTAAHSTLDRIDQIRVRVYNHILDGLGQRIHVIEYQAGTAGSGVGPTLPANAYEIAKINVPHSGGGAPSVTMTARPPVAAGGGRPGTTSGDFEVYNIATGTWVRIAQTVGAHFMGGYDPGTPSNITNNTWVPMPITDLESSSRVTLTGSNKLVINEGGLYACDGSVRVGTGTAAGTGIFARFSVNGVEKRTAPNPPTTSSVFLRIGCKLLLNVGDELRFEVFQDQGSARPFSLSSLWNRIDIARVS